MSTNDTGICLIELAHQISVLHGSWLIDVMQEAYTELIGDVVTAYGISDKTHQHALFIFFKYLLKIICPYEIEEEMFLFQVLPLITTVCVWIAHKFETVKSIKITDCVVFTNFCFTKRQILEVEADILDTLNYKIIPPGFLEAN